MNGNRLRLFCAVVEAKGVTRAAQRLPVSLQIKRLERELGLPLFTRVGC